MGDYKVYMHRCPNGKVYVGITSYPPKTRWQGGYGYKQHKRFYQDILKYGWDNIQHLILFEDLSMEQAREKEKELIVKYNSCDENFGYNIKDGGQIGAKKKENIESKYKNIFRIKANDLMIEELKILTDYYGISKENVVRMLIAKETRLIEKRRKELK